MVLYSDGVSEATNQAEEELGRDGLMNIARGLDRSSAEAFGMQLTSALRDFRGGVDALDDETIIVLQRVARPWRVPTTRLIERLRPSTIHGSSLASRDLLRLNVAPGLRQLLIYTGSLRNL